MNPPREESERPLLGASTRRGMVLLSAGLVGVFAVAAWLEPNPKGFGTHTQLGLPPCQFAWVTGRLCPSCGMTTSFAWFVRGRLDRAFRANPGGAFLAPACAFLVPWLLAGAVRGKPLGSRTLERPLIGLVVATVALSLVSWTIRLFSSYG
jgi:hypothetical protein